jgi:hypothetical protein
MQGTLDLVDLNGGVYGWVADPARPSVPVTAVVTVDGVVISSAPTDQPSPDVTAAFPSFTGLHRFKVPIPALYKDGQPHVYRVYGLQVDGVRSELTSKSPTTATIGGSSVNPLQATVDDLTAQVATLKAQLAAAIGGAPIPVSINAAPSVGGHPIQYTFNGKVVT